METPEAPRRTRRKKEPSETPADSASGEDSAAEPVAAPTRRPRKPKTAPEPERDVEMIAATDAPLVSDTPVMPAESEDTIHPAPDGPLVFTFEKPTAIEVKPETTTLSPISPAANAADNEPEMFKPLMAQPTQPTQQAVPMKPYSPSTQANPKPVTILRTVILRNVEIGQKYSASAGRNLRKQTDKLAEPIGNARSEVDKTLQRWQRSLETDDSAVVATTLIAIIACVVLTLLVVALLQR